MCHPDIGMFYVDSVLHMVTCVSQYNVIEMLYLDMTI